MPLNLDLYETHRCKLDEKGRFLFPGAVLQQIPPEHREHFVLNKEADKCLVLYPKAYFQEIWKRINSQNRFVQKVKQLRRTFKAYAKDVKLDGNNRLLIPRQLMEMAELEKEILVVADGDLFEIWNPNLYEQALNHGDEYADLMESVMGAPTTEE